jgi:hypothetical protein
LFDFSFSGFQDFSFSFWSMSQSSLKMSQHGIDLTPLLMEDGCGSTPVFTESDFLREGMISGLEVEPEAGFCHGQIQKGKHETVATCDSRGGFGRSEQCESFHNADV